MCEISNILTRIGYTANDIQLQYTLECFLLSTSKKILTIVKKIHKGIESVGKLKNEQALNKIFSKLLTLNNEELAVIKTICNQVIKIIDKINGEQDMSTVSTKCPH